MSVTFLSLRRDSYLLGNEKFEAHESHVNSIHNGKRTTK